MIMKSDGLPEDPFIHKTEGPYLRFLMGVAHFPEIFQAKMSELMQTIEFVLTYIDDLLCINKGSLDDHLSKPKRVFISLQYCNTITSCLLVSTGILNIAQLCGVIIELVSKTASSFVGVLLL
jgi:hypothetical protein